MHIDAVSIYHVALPRKRPKVIAGRPCEMLETVLIKLSSGGAVGWGEAAPGNAPNHSGEWAAGAFAVLRDWLAPCVVNAAIDSGKTLAERLSPFQGNQYAKAAIDIAWWDLATRIDGRPLHEVLQPTPLTALRVMPIISRSEMSTLKIGACLDQMESTDEFMQALARGVSSGLSPREAQKSGRGWAIEMLPQRAADISLRSDPRRLRRCTSHRANGNAAPLQRLRRGDDRATAGRG